MKRGLKAVALFEASKGILVLFAGAALFSLVHQNLQVAAEQLVAHLHLNPAKHIPRIFIDAASSLTDSRLRLLALSALSYSSIRFVEAYGLWFARRWAEWLALLSGGVYLPVELYELAQGFTWLKIVFVLINFLVVLYMIIMLKRNGTASAS
jgi:uncharacterized membrane protein (DUF2068 family)